MQNLAGQELKGYTLKEQIGTGGFGSVYRAEQPAIGREVAIKIILPQYANHPDFIRRFEAEAQLVARLEHPFIVPLYDYWRDPDGAYLVMRFLRGGTLKDGLTERPWTLDETAGMLDQVAQALAVAHRSKVVHRDMKPENVMLDEDGNAYLTDFGIAKQLKQDEAMNLTTEGSIMGSPAYISPEQINGEEITPATDIYSLGIMTYEMLAGELPFKTPELGKVLLMHLRDPIPDITVINPDLPKTVDAVLQRATAKDPAARYQNALAMASAFRRAVTGSGSVTGTQPLSRSDISTDERERAAMTPTDLDLPEPVNPYKGLRPFEEADADDFFGRDALIQQLIDHLGDEDSENFMAVVGPSGSGKSSAVKAGLVPALRDGRLPNSDQWFLVEMVPGAHPIEELEAALLRVAVNPPESLMNQLESDERGLVRAVKRVLPADESIEIGLFVDQFEEVFTQVESEQERKHFLDLLATAASEPRSRLRIIITLRADFYDRPLQYGRFGQIVRDNTQIVLPLSEEELAASITGPADRVGVGFEPELVAAIVQDVSDQPGMLPLLQYALTELFEQREGRQLTLPAYQEAGGVRGALARRAEQLYEYLSDDAQEAARQMFLRLVTLGEGTDDTRRRALLSELTGLGKSMEAVINAYGRARLLTFDRDSETREPTVEVAHEALIREWGRLREWLDRSRDDVRQQRRVSNATHEWQASGKDPSFLARGFRLVQLEEWVERTEFALNPDERAYIDASIARREEEQAAEKARQEREAALERRSRQVLTALVVVFLIAAIGASVLAVVAQQARVAAERQAVVNSSLTLATGAQLALADDNTDQAIVLALQANEIDEPPTQAERALAEAALSPGTRLVYAEGHEGNVFALDITPDGDTVASGGADGRVVLWDVESGELLRSIDAAHEDGVTWIDVSNRSNNLLLTGGMNGDVILWDLDTDTMIERMSAHAGRIRSVAFSSDDSMAVSTSDDGTAIVWDLDTGEILNVLDGHEDAVYTAVFLPGDGEVLTGSNDTHIIRWGVDSGEEVTRYEGHSGRINNIALSPDGSTFASAAGTDNAVFVWDLDTGEILHTLTGHADQPYVVSYSPDGSLLVTGSQDGSVRVWEANSGQEQLRLLGHNGGVLGVEFMPDGQHVISASQDGTLRYWDINNGAELSRFTGSSTTIYDVSYSPDGSLAVAATWDHTALVWDVSSGQVIQRLGVVDNDNPAVGHIDWLTEVEFTPDGERILTAGYDGTARLWNLRSGDLLQTYEGHENRIWALDVSPDGAYLATGSQDRTAILWDLESGEIVHTFTGHDGWVRGIGFSPDGTRVISGSGGDQTVRTWSVETGEELMLLEGHEEWLWHAAFIDDTYALSAASDGVVLMWDTTTGAILNRFIGHTGPVVDFEVTLDGQRLITASSDATIRVWDIETARELRRYAGHGATVWGIDLSPDGMNIVAGSADTTARTWDISFTREGLIEWVDANRFVRNLTCPERSEYQIEPLCNSDGELPGEAATE